LLLGQPDLVLHPVVGGIDLDPQATGSQDAGQLTASLVDVESVGGGEKPLADALAAAKAAAEAGRDATTPLLARKGRASYLGERSVGHQDPGATSTALLISALYAAAGARSSG